MLLLFLCQAFQLSPQALPGQAPGVSRKSKILVVLPVPLALPVARPHRDVRQARQRCLPSVFFWS